MFHWFKRHTKDGLELPDPTPHEITLREDFKRPLTIQEQIERFTRASDFQKAMEARGMDTLEDADDIEVDGEEEAVIEHLFGRTPYEAREDALDGVQTRLDEIHGGQVAEIPPDRLERAQERLKAMRAEGRPKPAPDQPARKEGAGGSRQEADRKNEENLDA